MSLVKGPKSNEYVVMGGAYARFQVAGEPCAGVCPKLATCGITGDPSGSVWSARRPEGGHERSTRRSVVEAAGGPSGGVRVPLKWSVGADRVPVALRFGV